MRSRVVARWLGVALACGAWWSCGDDASSDEDASSIDASAPDAATPDAEVVDWSIVETADGPVQGVVEDGFRAFKGIPFAAPPVGALRWQPPQPHDGWTAVRDATDFGPSCSQQPAEAKYGDSFDEDCLTLTVWTPYPVPESPAPVMVWFHWGGFNVGSSFSAWTNGQYIADATGTIVVAPNYRLGPLGFLAHPSLGAGAGNYGFLDQQAALAWVRDNIAGFGGDPDNVTIFGTDVGSASVCTHMTAPDSDGLFDRAIMESSSCPQSPLGYPTKAEAETQGELLASRVGCDGAGDVADCLRGKSAAELLAALTLKHPIWGGEATWAPVIDGTVLLAQPYDAVVAGDFSKVPLLIGANRDEGSIWFGGAQGMTEADYVDFVNTTFGTSASDLLAMYPASDYATPATAASQLTGDLAFVCAVRRVARVVSAAGPSTYLYHFTHPPHWTTEFYGAYHLAEVWIVFRTSKPEYGPHTPEEEILSDKVMGYWTRFAATGDPNGDGELVWPAYTEGTDSHMLLAPTIEVGSGLRQAKCDLWDSLAP